MTIKYLSLALTIPMVCFAMACGGGTPEAEAPSASTPETPATPEAPAAETPETPAETPAEAPAGGEEKKEEAPAPEGGGK